MHLPQVLLQHCNIIIISSLYPEDNYTVLLLQFRCSAIKINSFTLGAKDSRYNKTSIILIKPDLNSTETVLCEIQYYMKCKPAKTFEEDTSHTVLWFAAVQLLMGTSMQGMVWSSSWSMEYCTCYIWFTFIPVSLIQSLVVYVKTTFNFGRVIGPDSVYIITPLENNNLFT